MTSTIADIQDDTAAEPRPLTPTEEDDRWLWDDARYERRMDM